MLRSVLRGLAPGTVLDAHVVDAGLAAADRERLARMCGEAGASLTWHDSRSAGLDRLPLTSRMTAATYARLALPALLPDATKALWLDADVLVTGDLERLWTTDLDGHDLLAVGDPCVPLVSSRYGVRRWRELGLPEDARYFNAGVMAIDLDGWRRQDVAGRAQTYLRDRGADVRFWDQEGLNAVLCGRWGE